MPTAPFHRLLQRVAVGAIAATLAATAAAELPVARPEDVGISSERLARLDAALQKEVDSGAKAGIVALIARRGYVVHEKAYGFAELESRTPMTTEHLFRLFSMTKPITSVALLMLYEEGRFQLGDPLEKHIPAFKDLKVFAGLDGSGAMRLEEPKRKPTIHDVLRHTAGFGYGFGSSPVDRMYQEVGIDFGRMVSLEELVEEKLPKVPLLYHPGEQWVYSVAHDVQAFLVEHFSGMSFAEFCRERIFEPLGMRDTVFGVPREYVPRYTANYAPRDPANPAAGLIVVETPEGRAAPGGSQGFPEYARFTDIAFGGLSLSSTASDYALFAQMLVSGGALGDVRILGKKTVELMTSNHLPPGIPGIAASAPGVSPGATGYGLGVSVLLDPPGAGNLGSKGQFGWAGAASTWVIMDPQEELVLILLAQYLPADADFAARFQTLAYQAIVD
jgi:CubicO group peptidase (beta-lactamase class C family)